MTFEEVNMTYEKWCKKCPASMICGENIEPNDLMCNRFHTAIAQSGTPPTWLCYDCRQQWIISQAALAQSGKCPHGDPLCPCPDGDMCHYEGKNPMTPPSQSGTGEKCDNTCINMQLGFGFNCKKCSRNYNDQFILGKTE